jgi:hypothetical protein
MAYDEDYENFILTSIKDCLDKSDMSEDDKQFVTVSLWTQEQLPQIESDKQYEEYGKRQSQLMQSLPPHSDPGWSLAFAEFCRTPVGILANSLGARMIEWEEALEAVKETLGDDDD